MFTKAKAGLPADSVLILNPVLSTYRRVTVYTLINKSQHTFLITERQNTAPKTHQEKNHASIECNIMPQLKKKKSNDSLPSANGKCIPECHKHTSSICMKSQNTKEKEKL